MENRAALSRPDPDRSDRFAQIRRLDHGTIPSAVHPSAMVRGIGAASPQRGNVQETGQNRAVEADRKTREAVLECAVAALAQAQVFQLFQSAQMDLQLGIAPVRA